MIVRSPYLSNDIKGLGEMTKAGDPIVHPQDPKASYGRNTPLEFSHPAYYLVRMATDAILLSLLALLLIPLALAWLFGGFMRLLSWRYRRKWR